MAGVFTCIKLGVISDVLMCFNHYHYSIGYKVLVYKRACCGEFYPNSGCEGKV